LNPRNVARATYRRTRRRVAGWKAVLGRWLVPPDSDRAFRRRLAAEGASLHPVRPGRTWEGWVNRALRTQAESAAAVAEVTACGLPRHQDAPKNWDLLVALGLILDRTDPADPVLEMGAPSYTRLLPWLALYGYRDLRGIDLVWKAPARTGPIRFLPMDLTRTTFPDRSFAAIACLSVVEHGVDVADYLREAARLLRPGGLLVTSTDFWCQPIETADLTAYGGPVRVFTPADIEGWLPVAESVGLVPVRPLDLACDERVVTWERLGLRYTFVNVVLERRS
jgi:SAM-dependent methyltransferase